MKMPLSNEILKEKAGSIFATSPSFEVSDKYAFIPTIEVVDMFRANSWYPVEAKESFVRLSKNKGYQKHLIRFRHISDFLSNDEEAVEIVLTNSHNRTSSFIIQAGVFRFICANGLVVANNLFEKISIRHIGFKEIEVKRAIERIVASIEKINERISLYKQIELSNDEQLSLARASKIIRFKPYQQIELDYLLRPHRKEDENNDLWRVFNRIQENVIRGGVKGKNIFTGRNFTSKPVKSIDSLISINEKLFDLTDKFASIKLSA
ncbi:conserved hypothetical protein [Lebetimonas natsushimae]|uniref:DUF945 domain-containing protein n=1 Tax=Lebetimonas natsushimae TaxID=1936991 RepID=A0A292YBW5_9BACT|nr:DUF932 domain-containing protein [Lebetimonas natsushimae]GAX87026.1 conserved hypothetical protein [Lebetimonas natsushimae]